jgi:hypothetical protein
MRTEKIIGLLLISGSILLFIPYTILTITFNYPTILREDTGKILTEFHAGGTSLTLTWWSFAMVGLPILAAYVLLGQKLENKLSYIKIATVLAITSGIVQIVGLLRWTFVVPIIANTYVKTSSESTRESCALVFQIVHQYGGVVLGEHLGQLFTIIWTVMITSAFKTLKLMPNWIIWLGYISSLIYFLAQAELVSTVVPAFPVWSQAGLLGSTLWLFWLIIVGIKFLKIEIEK